MVTSDGAFRAKGFPQEPVSIDEPVIDCDAHIRESKEDLLPYVEDDEAKGYIKSPLFNYPPRTGWDFSGGGRVGFHTNRTPADQREFMDAFSIDAAVIVPTATLYTPKLGDQDVANALCQAFNDYVVDVWLDAGQEFTCGVMVPVNDPERGAEEIDRVGVEDGMVYAMLPPLGPEKALGDRRYDPIYEAAQRHDLTIAMHGAGDSHVTFPGDANYMHKFLEVHTTTHPIQQMIQITSLLCQGVPERFPDLRFFSMEAGLTWIPFLKRLDAEFLAKPHEAPLLEQKPSEYFRERFWLGSQPLEEIGHEELDFLVNFVSDWDRIVFAADWPHFDFDSPTVVDEKVPETHQSAVRHENARELFPGI